MSTISAGTSNTTSLVYTGDTTGNLAFQTNGTTEAMRIGSNGLVGINTTTPLTNLTVDTNTANYTDGIMIANRSTGTWGYGSSLSFANIPSNGGSLTTVGQIQQYYQASNKYGLSLYSYDSGLNRSLNINSNGNIALLGGGTGSSGVGITFPTTQVASSDPNCLDDYEEGTFTPTAANFTTTNYTMTGTYVKIGKLVWVSVVLTCTGTVGWSTSALIDLPFASSSGTSGNFIATRNTNSTSNISTNNNNFAYPDLANARVFLGSFSVAMGTGDKFTLTGTYLTTS